jgi:hypothetical protein
VSPVRYELGYVLEDDNLHSHCHENFYSYRPKLFVAVSVGHTNMCLPLNSFDFFSVAYKSENLPRNGLLQ